MYEAIEKVKNIAEDKINYSSLKSNSKIFKYLLIRTNFKLTLNFCCCKGSSDNNLDQIDDSKDEQVGDEQASGAANQTPTTPTTQTYEQQRNQHQQHRANTTMHVCWHRNTSVGYQDNHRSVINQLSGYLLRKFKNSNGWQKLWVVFTNFCLFFYKTYQVCIF